MFLVILGCYGILNTTLAEGRMYFHLFKTIKTTMNQQFTAN